MGSKLIAKIVAFITLVGTVVAAFKIKEAKDINKGRDEVAKENTEQALEDINTKREVQYDIEELIDKSTRDERINRL